MVWGRVCVRAAVFSETAGREKIPSPASLVRAAGDLSPHTSAFSEVPSQPDFT